MQQKFKSVLRRAESRQILKDEREDGSKKEKLLKRGLKEGDYRSSRVRKNGEDVTVVECVQAPQTYGAIDI
jgi:hypothetical protein